MQNWKAHLKSARRWLVCAGLALLCLGVCFCLWLTNVRGLSGKSLSYRLNDDYTQFSSTVEESVTQEFSADYDIWSLSMVFGNNGTQPTGTLELALLDAVTGEVLGSGTGEMANILPGQYTGLGFTEAFISGSDGSRYRIRLTPHYTGSGRLTVGYSTSPALDGCAMVDGTALTGSLALVVTFSRVGGFLTKYFLVFTLLLTLFVCGSWLLVSGKRFHLSRTAFVLVLALGVLYSFLLPPYSVPDEQYHINQAFTLAQYWGNHVTTNEEGWVMRNVPPTFSYRRPDDKNTVIQDQRTTVFTWKEYAKQLSGRSAYALGDHIELDEAQADSNPTLYFFSALGVFLGFCLRLGFAPTLLLGRACNLLVFALLVAAAIRRAPFGKPLFLAVALLPMTLHLGASFSRDSLLLGLCFYFTALCMDLAFGEQEAPRRRLLVLLAVCGILIAPAKAVYFPLLALVLLIPAARIGKHSGLCKAGFLALCLVAFLSVNHSLLTSVVTISSTPAAVESSAATAGTVSYSENGRTTVSIRQLSAAADAVTVDAPATDTGAGDDSVCYTLGYCLTHLPDVFLLVVRSAIDLGDHYIRTLVGGSLSYYSLDLAWGWVILLYGLLAAAVLLCAGQTGIPAGRTKLWCAVCLLAVCGLIVLGCISWTPTYYTTIYGLQGRYFLPVLPLALLLFRPRALTVNGDHTPALAFALAAVNAGVLLNILLAVIAR